MSASFNKGMSPLEISLGQWSSLELLAPPVEWALYGCVEIPVAVISLQIYFSPWLAPFEKSLRLEADIDGVLRQRDVRQGDLIAQMADHLTVQHGYREDSYAVDLRMSRHALARAAIALLMD